MENLGNTCYLNACVQLLAAIPGLPKLLESSSTASLSNDSSKKLESSLCNVLSILSEPSASEQEIPSPITPSTFYAVL